MIQHNMASRPHRACVAQTNRTLMTSARAIMLCVLLAGVQRQGVCADLNYTDLAELLVPSFHVVGIMHTLLVGLPVAIMKDVLEQFHKNLSISDLMVALHNVRSCTKRDPIATRFDIATGRHFVTGPCWHLLLAADELVRPRTGYVTALDHLDKYDMRKARTMFYYLLDRVYNVARRSDQSEICFFIHNEDVFKRYDLDAAETLLGAGFRERSYRENLEILTERLVDNVEEAESGELKLMEEVVTGMLYTVTYLYSIYTSEVKQKYGVIHSV